MTDTATRRVIVTRSLPAATERRLAELFDVELNLDDHSFSREELKAAVARASVLVPTVTDHIDSDVIAAAGPQLKLIASFGTGVDHIDLDAARARNIMVSNTPGVLSEDVADTVMALILCVSRRLIEGERFLREGRWQGWSPNLLLGHRIRGKHLGIIGLGRIGQAVARRARTFGMTLHYHSRRQVHPEIETELKVNYWPSLDQMLAHMDIVSVHCPHTPATYHLLSARRLRLLQSHAILVNTSRGGVIDEDALADLLEAKQLGGAALDVYENEPQVSERLLALPNTVLLPHIGSATLEGREAMGERVVLNIRVVLDGHKPPDWVLESYLPPV